MTSCPSEETLKALLAEALNTAGRDNVARHVEGCASCQEQLARLTGTSDAEKPRRDGQLASIPMPATLAVGRTAREGARKPAPVGSEQPSVPGYEILRE